ncbi:hypothetical protein GCM10020258_31100 [Sphingomonas yabuuchiae]
MTRNAFRLALAGATMLAGLGAATMWSAPAMAQAGQAALRGVIRTAPDNPLQDVTLVEVDTGFRRTVVPGADGSYNFPSLRAGAYRLEIRLQNGTRNSDQFTLRVGQNAGLDLDLTTAPAPAQPAPGDNTAGETAPPPAEAQQGDIIVTGSRIRSLSGGQVGINITPRLIEQLPQNSRNFLAFADLAPGVRFIESSDGSSRIQGGAQGATRSTSLSMASARRITCCAAA